MNLGYTSSDFLSGGFLRDKAPMEQSSIDLKRQRLAAEEMLIKLKKEIPLLH